MLRSISELELKIENFRLLRLHFLLHGMSIRFERDVKRQRFALV
jgi:hypothetical protein